MMAAISHSGYPTIDFTFAHSEPSASCGHFGLAVAKSSAGCRCDTCGTFEHAEP